MATLTPIGEMLKNQAATPGWVDPYDLTGMSGYNVLKQQYKNWQEQFKPVELATLNMLSFNNPDVIPNATAEAATSATNISESMQDVMGRSEKALGVSETEQQKKVSGRLAELNKVANVAGAENMARANVKLQDQQLLTGLSSLKSRGL